MSTRVAPAPERTLPEYDYQAGLSKRREPVISSHFMDAIARDGSLQPYPKELLLERAQFVSSTAIDEHLLPVLREESLKFSQNRAEAAVARARENFTEYGLAGPAYVTEAEAVAELLFDRQFSRKANRTRSRRGVRDEVALRLADDRRIRLVMPALPFKILCPLKARGVRPDLAEVDLILSLFEIAHAIEVIPRLLSDASERIAARFVVISDGRRFASIVNVPSEVIEEYRIAVEGWILRLGVQKHVGILDYWDLLNERLPDQVLDEKQRITSTARELYYDRLRPAFDIHDMKGCLVASRALEPDPEIENPEGRFAALFKSLIYTVNYRSLEELALPIEQHYSVYREMTASLFAARDATERLAGSSLSKEALRKAMLREVWQATIEYMAEIKSDRDLENDPVLTSIPDAIRWTIHAKAGQFAIMTPSIQGAFVQAWAGSGFIRRTKRGSLRLGSYPVLGLEGRNAIPVFESSAGKAHAQPLFYIDSEVGHIDIESLAGELSRSSTRRRLR